MVHPGIDRTYRRAANGSNAVCDSYRMHQMANEDRG